jgi:hypothetical protein
VKELDAIAARLRGGTALAGLLDAGFDAFEVIRLVARAGEDLAPELFAAFITTAGTAVQGRNALNDAPSLPTATGPPPAPAVSLTVGADQIADELATLAALLTERLAEASAQAFGEGDRAACQHATCAAADIHRLLARGLDETAAR